MKAMKEEVIKKKKGVVICCGKMWRDTFQMQISQGNYPQHWLIHHHNNDIVTIGPYLTWGHLDAQTSRLSFLPLGTQAMKIWIYARTK